MWLTYLCCKPSRQQNLYDLSQLSAQKHQNTTHYHMTHPLLGRIKCMRCRLLLPMIVVSVSQSVCPSRGSTVVWCIWCSLCKSLWPLCFLSSHLLNSECTHTVQCTAHIVIQYVKMYKTVCGYKFTYLKKTISTAAFFSFSDLSYTQEQNKYSTYPHFTIHQVQQIS